MLLSQPTTFPLAKFSSAQHPARSKPPYNWRHSTGGLRLILDNFRPEGLYLKVLQQTQVLEIIEVEGLVRRNEEMIKEFDQQGASWTAEHLPIRATVKYPLLAISYTPLSPQNQLCLVQLKFESQADFNAVITPFRHLDLPILDRRPGTAGFFDQNHRSPGVSGSSGPSCPPSQLQEMSSTPHKTRSSATLPPHSPSAPSSQVQSTGSTVPPASAYASLMNRERDLDQSASVALPNALKPPQYFNRPSSSSSPTRPRTPAASSVFTIRPGTSDGTLSLPPRRELPFARPSTPASSGNDGIGLGRRVSSVAMPPPPRPGSGRTEERGMAKARSVIDENDLPPLPRPTPKRARPSSSNSSLHGHARSSTPQISPLEGDEDVTPGSSPLSPLKAAVASSASIRNTHQDRVLSELSANPCGGLATFTALSGEDRMLKVNNFFLQHLDDDNFLSLVECVETCWAQLGAVP